ncbi:Semaphorin-3E [Clarias magur]|uniref:Semaphorin-3E n=1 Tax=Clarias magur TaxID=1594786 RepID=A0A8J4UHY8_CLAMG|nr:Semaphorin-3E [Clarias magur]
MGLQRWQEVKSFKRPGAHKATWLRAHTLNTFRMTELLIMAWLHGLEMKKRFRRADSTHSRSAATCRRDLKEGVV